MLRHAVAIGSAVLVFIGATAASMFVGEAVRPWAPTIVEKLGPGTVVAIFLAVLAGGAAAVHLLQRRHERREYAATGIITVEKPHPWPMWVRVVAMTPFLLALIGIGIAIVTGK